MSAIITILIVFVAIQLLVSLSNLVLFSSLNIKDIGDRPEALVSVLIPARDEQENIGNLLDDIALQSYGNFEVVVYDDMSKDCTSQIVEEFSSKITNLKLIKGGELPVGWLGKNFACFSLSKEAKGDYLLFLDADVRVGSDMLERVINYHQKRKLSLLSIFPVQIMKSVGEWLTVPLMNQILLSLLPLPLVRSSSRQSLSAANGQFMLFDRVSYFELNPHFELRVSRVEDIDCARMFKKRGRAVACLPGSRDIECRMYSGLRSATDGFSKNIVRMFGNSPFAAALYWLLWVAVAVVPILAPGEAGVAPLVLMELLVIITISALSRQNIVLNIITFVPRQFILGYIILRSVFTAKRGNLVWKGRNI